MVRLVLESPIECFLDGSLSNADRSLKVLVEPFCWRYLANGCVAIGMRSWMARLGFRMYMRACSYELERRADSAALGGLDDVWRLIFQDDVFEVHPAEEGLDDDDDEVVELLDDNESAALL